MKALSELLGQIEYRCVAGTVDVQVNAVVYDSRKVAEGCLFICIAGANADGHDFAAEAAEKGAKVLVTEKEVAIGGGSGITVIQVADTRYAMAFIAAACFCHPAEELKTIGIT